MKISLRITLLPNDFYHQPYAPSVLMRAVTSSIATSATTGDEVTPPYAAMNRMRRDWLLDGADAAYPASSRGPILTVR